MSHTDQYVRTLFTDAAGDVPAGIDLLHGFQARKAARRTRGRVALGAAGASLVAAVTAVTLSFSTAPSALAQVTSAASRTAGLSYDVAATVAAQPLRAGSGMAVSGQVSGAFDPARKIGETTLRSAGSESQRRFIGPYVYSFSSPRLSGLALPGGKSWIRAASSQLWEPATATQGLNLGDGLSSLLVTSPQSLLALLKSASTVTREGSTSGDGWTGNRYAFTATFTFGPGGSSEPAVTAAGTVGLDQQGRVRRLTLAYTQPAQASLPPVRVTGAVTFSDFGTAVSVSPPPASEVYTPAHTEISPAPVP